MPNKVFSWCTEGGLNVQGQGTQTPSAGSLKYRQLKDVFVQVHGNVSSQLIWKVMQQLRRQEKVSLSYQRTAQCPVQNDISVYGAAVTVKVELM